MDPMDYTMDDGQSIQQPNSAPRCHHQQPHLSNSNNFSPHAHDGHHYDPVHNTDVWYQANNPNMQSRPPYSAPQNISGWNPGPYVPIHSWHGFNEAHGGISGEDGSGYRAQAGYMGMPNSPWNSVRDYGQAIPPYGYSAYPTVPPTENASSRISAQASAASAAASQGPSSFSQQVEVDLQRRADRMTGAVSGQSSVPQRLSSEINAGIRDTRARAMELEERSIQMRQDAAQTRASRYVRAYSSQDPPHIRRRNGHGYDSDDDDDPNPDIDIEIIRRSSDMLFEGMDDERSMAAMRAQIAAAKKVPSKDAIAALERVNPKDLKEADRSCIICYNEFGVANPEGIVEAPIRLPKCKHVFGNKCIKKWFEDSDSCPYCRDKLPSELSLRKTAALETFRAYRAAGLGRANEGGHRVRHGFTPRYPTSEDYSSASTSAMLRSPEEYHHYIMSRNENWGFSPPNRSSPADTPENRRRQARGRIGNRPHLLGRPTSVGSARNIIPAANPLNTSQGPYIVRLPPALQTSGNTPRRSITPGLTSQPSNPGSSTTPPRNRLSSSLSSSPEEASPPVAVGSGVPAGERSITPPTTSQRQNSSFDQDSFGGFLNNQVNYISGDSRIHSYDTSAAGGSSEARPNIAPSQYTTPETGNSSEPLVQGLDIIMPLQTSHVNGYSAPMPGNHSPDEWSR